jgi:hypothetical protein
LLILLLQYCRRYRHLNLDAHQLYNDHLTKLNNDLTNKLNNNTLLGTIHYFYLLLRKLSKQFSLIINFFNLFNNSSRSTCNTLLRTVMNHSWRTTKNQPHRTRAATRSDPSSNNASLSNPARRYAANMTLLPIRPAPSSKHKKDITLVSSGINCALHMLQSRTQERKPRNLRLLKKHYSCYNYEY